MSCSSCTDNSFNESAICPVNGKSYRRVSNKTIMHQIKKPWLTELDNRSFYFCTDPDCNVVYFDEQNQLIEQDQLRNKVGQKSSQANKTICYCFDVTLTDINKDLTRCKNYVIQQTKKSACDCEIRNPSGRCCLKDFPRH